MLNFNDVGRPLCRIVGGKCDKMVILVSDKFSSKEDDETMMKSSGSSRSPMTPNSSKSQTPQRRERDNIYIYIYIYDRP